MQALALIDAFSELKLKRATATAGQLALGQVVTTVQSITLYFRDPIEPKKYY